MSLRIACGLLLHSVLLLTPSSGQQPSEIPGPAVEQELKRFKQQALQSVTISSGGLIDFSGYRSLSSSFVQGSIGSGIPLGSFDNILAVTPGFRIDFIDADPSLDVPEELYLFETQFFYRRTIRDRLSAMAIFSPSVRSDLTTGDDAFRVFGLGLLTWDYYPDLLSLSGGVVFLGRADLPALPAVGLTWTPRRNLRLDLRFPESTLGYRLQKDGARSETWVRMGMGIGGNTWAATRNSGQSDLLSLRDIRLTTSIEKLKDGGGGWFIQSGYAFNRRVEFETAASEISLGDALLLEAGWRY
ncbi:MAG: hypothetical protein ACE361_02060 [Aureliella sp.]